MVQKIRMFKVLEHNEKEVEQYAGQWVGIVGDEIVAHGEDAEIVYEEVIRRFPGVEPALCKIPEDKVMIL